MEYWKINSLWKRQGWYFDQDKKKSPDYQEGRQSFIVGDYAVPEFACIKNWRVTEKIDGTNIRIEFTKSRDESGTDVTSLEIKGRTDNAMIPPHLLKYLQRTFTEEKLYEVFSEASGSEYFSAVLFGEGYGPKIQACGGLYANEPGFCLFDVVIGRWVLKFDDIAQIATSFGVPCVYDLGVMSESDLVDYVKSQPLSTFSKVPQVMEGIVAFPEPLMMFRKGAPIKMKLKCKEFR